jgi:hypothetical protein
MLYVGIEDCEEGVVYIASYIWLNMVVAYYSKQHVARTLSEKCWYPSTKEQRVVWNVGTHLPKSNALSGMLLPIYQIATRCLECW